MRAWVCDICGKVACDNGEPIPIGWQEIFIPVVGCVPPQKRDACSECVEGIRGTLARFAKQATDDRMAACCGD